jgi:hypothetical protein
MTTFTARWEEAQGEQRTGDIMVDRLIAPGLNALREIQSTSLIGQGIGLGSNFAAALQNGSQGFLLSESEPVRVTEECGAVVGLLLMAYRLGLCLEMLYSSYKATRRTPLPFLLAAATSPVLLLNTMEQPTNLGFMVFGAGLAFAATAHARKKRPSQLVQRPQDSHQEWHNAVYVCNP